MTRFERLIGAAGTGKTTTLLNIIAKAVDDGLTLTDLWMMSFTRAQRDDLRLRLSEIFPRAKRAERDAHVRTIHGAALASAIHEGLLNNNRLSSTYDRIIVEDETPGSFITFCRQHGLKYNKRAANPFNRDRVSIYQHNMPTGNALFALGRYIKMLQMSISEWMLAAAQMGISINRSIDIENLLYAWQDYKVKHHLWEHEDYVDAVLANNLAPLAPTIVIDEFQDVSPNQYALVEQWYHSRASERIIIAGDPNQTIYSFRGAHPKYLMEFPNRFCVQDIGAGSAVGLPQSYRCPPEIIAYADNLLHARSNMLPAPHHGIVLEVPIHHPAHFVKYVVELHRRYGEVMVLTRFTRTARAYSDMLLKWGIPHSSLISGRVPHWETIVVNKTSDSTGVNSKCRIIMDMDALLMILHQIDAFLSRWGISTIPIGDARKLLHLSHRSEELLISMNLHSARSNSPAQRSQLSENRTAGQLQISAPTTPTDITPIANSDQIQAASSSPVASTEPLISIPQLMQVAYPDIRNIHQFIEQLQLCSDRKYALHRVFYQGIKHPITIHPADIVVDTIHSAKGLESPAVILDAGVIQCRLTEPHLLPEVLNEERRVYYVGATRARNALVVMNYFENGTVMSPVFDKVIV